MRYDGYMRLSDYKAASPPTTLKKWVVGIALFYPVVAGLMIVGLLLAGRISAVQENAFVLMPVVIGVLALLILPLSAAALVWLTRHAVLYKNSIVATGIIASYVAVRLLEKLLA